MIMKLNLTSIVLLSVAALLPAGAQAAVHNYTVTTTANSGFGSLRDTMQTAMDASEEGIPGDEYVVRFAFPSGVVQTIRPTTGLPLITGAITIDATTLPGYAGTPLIELDGSLAPNASGLTVHNTTLKVRGLAINRFDGYGINASPASGGAGLIVTGCHIGTNAAGTAAAPNGSVGIKLRAHSATTGGVASQIGGTGANQGNVISGNGGSGLDIFAGDAITIVNNKIGTNRAGTAAIPNNGNGVFLDCYNVAITVGGPGAARNVISGNTSNGLFFWNAPFLTTVRNNIIGLGADGTTDLGNGGDGLSSEAAGITVGGPAVTDGNIISGNTGHGIRFYHNFYDEIGDPSVSCRNNLIGTDSSGTVARGNSAGGILVDLHDWIDDGIPPTGDPQVLVVIGATGAGNVISGNGGHGVTVMESNALLLGNLIGVTRSAAPLGNASSGVRVINSAVAAGQAPSLANGNIIGANTSHGISVTGASSLTAHGNYIGCTATGADVGNGGDGIQHGPWIGSGIFGVTSIGGTGAGMGNSIAYNNGDGVYLTEPFGIGSSYLSILGNSIWANTGMGIDLGNNGLTLNDVGDVDSGANHRQNFPVLLAATPTKVLGRLDSTPNTRFRIECFRAEADATGYGEGRYYLGSVDTTSNSTGLAIFGLTGLTLSAGQTITATASVIGTHPDPAVTSDLIQDTSEFASNVAVGAEQMAFALSSSAVAVSEGAGTATITVQRSGVTNLAGSVQYFLQAGTATAGADYTAAAGTLSFLAGETSKTFTVPIINDLTDEPDQTFSAYLSFPIGGLISSPGSTVVSIIDNDAAPYIYVPAYLAQVEGHSGSTEVVVTIALTAPSEKIITGYTFPNVLFNAGTATHQVDYTYEGSSGVSFEIAPGQTQYTRSFNIVGDMTAEPDETINFILYSAENATLGNSTCVITIINDDDASSGTLQFAEESQNASENAGTATITVTRTGGTGGAASVNYALIGGTATPGSDFLAANTSGTLSFAHGQSTASFTITLVNDYLPEGPETMLFQLSGVTAATLGVPNVTTLTITDTDNAGTVQFAAATSSIAENGGTATITVSRTGGTDGPATVAYARTGGTATVGSDFTAAGTSGTLNFAHGQSTGSFTVTVLDDFTLESAETLIFQLSAATSATLGSPSSTTLTITENEVAFSIMGRVRRADGSGIAGAQVTLTGSQNASVTTNGTGDYAFSSVVGGLNYAVVTVAEGFVFAPDTFTYTSLSANATGQDFVGTAEVIPELGLSFLSDGRTLLTWIAPSTGWNLMSSTTLAAGSWLPVNAPITQRGGYNQVTLTTAGRTFFRLTKVSSGDEEM